MKTPLSTRFRRTSRKGPPPLPWSCLPCKPLLCQQELPSNSRFTDHLRSMQQKAKGLCFPLGSTTQLGAVGDRGPYLVVSASSTVLAQTAPKHSFRTSSEHLVCTECWEGSRKPLTSRNSRFSGTMTDTKRVDKHIR